MLPAPGASVVPQDLSKLGGPRIRLSAGRGVVRHLRWTGFAAAVLAIVLAMPPMSAVASTVETVSGPELEYKSLDPGNPEPNVLSISRDACSPMDPMRPCDGGPVNFYFREHSGVSITALPACGPLRPPVPANPSLAWCPDGDASGNPVVRVTVFLGAQDDHLIGVTDTLTPSQPPFPLTALGEAGIDNLAGGPGNDDLQGGNGNDELAGGAGDDRLLGEGAGTPLESDVLSGGEGTDTAPFSERTEPLTIDLDGRADDGEYGEDDNVQPDVETLIGGSADDTLIGSDIANLLDGRDGEDTLLGGGGDDSLDGGRNEPSADNLSGGSGSDTMEGRSGDDSLVGGEGDDIGRGGGGGDRMEGEAGNDTFEGGAGADAVDGGEGNDWLDGGARDLVGGDGPDDLIGGGGNDWLFGGRGNDRLDGGDGADFMSGGSERDTVTYEDRTNAVSVTLDDLSNDGEAGERDNVRRDVEVVLGGMSWDDLSGDADVNTVEGARGEDYVDGKGERDRLLGGDAPDIVRAHDGEGDDVACGDGVDLAIADGQDKVIECETVDRPGARQPDFGRYARVRREGRFQLRLPEGRRFFPLNQDVKIPIESTIDPRAKAVGLVTENRGGARQVAAVSEGRFSVRQGGGRRPVTELRLAGRLPACRGSSTRGGGATRAGRSSARSLRVSVGESVSGQGMSKGAQVVRAAGRRRRGHRFSVRGRYSSGASDGTAWLTEDRCDGTLTTVISGLVRVRDFGRGRTVRVRPGKPYLAAGR